MRHSAPPPRATEHGSETPSVRAKDTLDPMEADAPGDHPHESQDIDPGSPPHPGAVDALFSRLDALLPGAFSHEETDGDHRWRRAEPSREADLSAGIEVSAFWDEITVGMGDFAHSHFQLGEADSALALALDLAEGRIGCIEARGADGRITWACFVHRSEAEKGTLPTIRPGDESARLRFFTAFGSLDLIPERHW